jgi:hypothetical protein
MKITAKLRRIGTSLGILIPREMIQHYNAGDMIEIELPGAEELPGISVVSETEKFVKPSFNPEWCEKHTGVRKGSCGCQ